MSMIESSAPTSCRCTRSIGVSWMAASASASRSNRCTARSWPSAVSADRRMAVDDVLQMVMRVRARGCPAVVARGFSMHTELRRRDARAADPLGRHLAVFDRQAAERAAEPVERQPEIEQRAEDHVARRAGETVEIQRLRPS